MEFNLSENIVGSTIIERNSYKTLASAKLWAKGHNTSMNKRDSKIIKVIRLMPTKKKKRKVTVRKYDPFAILRQ